MSKTIAGHETDATVIIDKGEGCEDYRYFLKGLDLHEFPVWPDEIEHYRNLLNEFEDATQ